MTPTPTPIDLIIDSLAVHRATRLLHEDTITEDLRQAVWSRFPPQKYPHSPSAALECPYCISIYASVAVAATHIPKLRFLRPVVYILAAASFTAIMSDRRTTNTGWS